MQSSVSFLIFTLGYLTFGILAIMWISKKKKRGEKISLRAKIIIAVVFFSSSSALISMIKPSPAPSTTSDSIAYYIKSDTANVLECPSTSCKIIGAYPQNTELTFPGDLFDKYPDWVEVTFPDGNLGYVSKTVLSENVVSASQPSSAGEPSSIGGITIGHWDNIQTTVGESYEFHFCEPSTAISGATCGGLADTATNPTEGKPPYSFVKKSGFLPPGMALELNGTLSGSLTEAGTYKFRLCAKDLYGGEGCQNLRVVVKEEVSQTPSPSESAIIEQPITEQIPDYGNTIDSMTCSLTPSKNEFDDWSNIKYHAYGSAWGPAGTEFYTVGSSYVTNFTCGSWSLITTNTTQYCKRGPDDSEKTTWSEDSAWSTPGNSARIIVSTKCCYHPTEKYIVKDYPHKDTDITQQCSR
ncbi:SH3 domain-containing protein [Candidatus Wolfebacteria bacterium]|nr:SH3 domain-containing protein [Candidatus Wolfebacteria bacterium]